MSFSSYIQGVPTAFNTQRALSKAQAVPIVGPVVVSPIKLVVSLIEAAAGLVFGGMFLGLATSTGFLFGVKPLTTCGAHFVLGTASALYAVVNFFSFGAAGLAIEGQLAQGRAIGGCLQLLT